MVGLPFGVTRTVAGMEPPGMAVPPGWYVACFSSELRRKPLARTLWGIPMVLFRAADAAPVALLDRCPHRNVPLSCGAVKGGLLECCYHGWRFDAAGACRAIPGLDDGEVTGRRAHRAPSYPVREQDGLVWVARPPAEPATTEPYRPPHLHDPRYTTVRRHVRFYRHGQISS